MGGQTGLGAGAAFLFVFLFLAARIAKAGRCPWRSSVASRGRHRRLSGHLDLRAGEQHLFPDRTGDARGIGGQERHLIVESSLRRRSRRDATPSQWPSYRGAAALPPDRVLLAGLHPRPAAAGLPSGPGSAAVRASARASSSACWSPLPSASSCPLLRVDLQDQSKTETMKRLTIIILLVQRPECSPARPCGTAGGARRRSAGAHRRGGFRLL